MTDPANFHCLSHRLRMTGTLETVTALHVGTGAAAHDAFDLPVLKDATGSAVIGGASLKGVLRSSVESILRAYGSGHGLLRTCDPFAKGGPERACGYTGADRKRKNVFTSEHCATCRLFGSGVLASHVRFTDLHCTSDVRFEVRDGVAIDRDLKRVRGGQKYDFEVVPPGAKFTVEVFVENPEDWLMGLLMVGFDQLDDGFSAIGGFTSRGLGRVRFRWNEITQWSATQLLTGEVPERWTDVKTKRKSWSDALANHAKGN